MTNIQKDAYILRKVLRELVILRKLTEIKDNIFTTKVIDVILPEACFSRKRDKTSPEEKVSSDTAETSEKGADNYDINNDINDNNSKGKVVPEETKDSKSRCDLRKLTHIFVVMELGENDLKYWMDKITENPQN
jgi:hypothetical protein